MTTKNTYDIHALQFAFDVCHKLFVEAHKVEAMEACAVLLKACETFQNAIKDTDVEAAEMLKEMETARSVNAREQNQAQMSYPRPDDPTEEFGDLFDLSADEYGDE